MQASEVPRAVAAAMSTASALDLAVDDAIVLRLEPARPPPDCRATSSPGSRPLAHQASAEIEVEVAQAARGRRTARWLRFEPRVEPRVYVRDGFEIAHVDLLRTCAVSRAPASRLRARARAPACRPAADRCHDAALHGSSRGDPTVVASRDVTPELADADRELLADTLRSLRRSIVDRRRRRAAAARRAAPVERAQHEERAALHRLRELLPAGRSSTTSPGCPKRSASAIRTLIKTWSASAGASCWRSSQRTAGVETTNTRAVDRRAEWLSAFREGPPWPALDLMNSRSEVRRVSGITGPWTVE